MITFKQYVKEQYTQSMFDEEKIPLDLLKKHEKLYNVKIKFIGKTSNGQYEYEVNGKKENVEKAISFE